MAQPLESYALLGDMQTAALVSRTGSVDWLCLPRFDSPAAFAALIGDDDNGSWRIAPDGYETCTRRHYRDDTLILETEWETTAGAVRVIDFMPLRDEAPDVARIVEGVSGRVEVTSEFRLRFDYGALVPWVRRIDGGVRAIAGPDAAYMRTPVPMVGKDFAHRAQFTVSAGDRIPFVLTWKASHLEPPEPIDAEDALRETESFWSEWVAQCTYDGEWRDAVVRSLITLKALTHQSTGGIVAAATTSLPEAPGGERNWDYRYCWLRDATMTLQALVYTGYHDEGRAWREWLLRAAAGTPRDLRIMYGIAGERRIAECELDWLSGYEGARPVRIGNAAVEQFQLDVYGEVLDLLHHDLASGLSPSPDTWALQCALAAVLEQRWKEPDRSLWEFRGDPRHFVHSKVMAWAGFDRTIRTAEQFGLRGPVDRWRAARDAVRDEVQTRGFDPSRATFTQSFDGSALDAATLLIPQVGFLRGDDERVRGTVEAIERELLVDGFVRRYDNDESADGLHGTEGAFIACTLWYADGLEMVGRTDDAREAFLRVLDVRNDVGLLAEEYDVARGRQLGNLPQAFSHVAVVNTARALSRHGTAAGRVHRHRPRRLG